MTAEFTLDTLFLMVIIPGWEKLLLTVGYEDKNDIFLHLSTNLEEPGSF